MGHYTTGIPDVVDSDDDNDGIPDEEDKDDDDQDNDGISDDIDDDDDNDGQKDSEDNDDDNDGKSCVQMLNLCQIRLKYYGNVFYKNISGIANFNSF